MNIVQTAIENGSFKTLVAAVTAAELPNGTVESLVLPENKEKLQSILTYHVVARKVLSSDLADGIVAIPPTLDPHFNFTTILL